MNKPIFITLIAIALLTLIGLTTQVTATGFSPSSLIYNLKVEEKQCKTITLISDSDKISVSDTWAENKDIEWKVSLFNKTANYHSISINYPSGIISPENKVEVCLSGNEVGEYHGVILLREEQQGNSIIQMGVWLKVTIAEPEQLPQPAQTISPVTGGGSSSGGGTSSPSKNENITTETEDKITKSQKKEEEIEPENQEIQSQELSRITGSSIGITDSWKGAGVVLLIAAFICALIIYTQKLNSRRNK